MRVLQVFNEYRQRAGEEIWVDRLPALAAPRVTIEDLRFRSSDWVGAGAPPWWRQSLQIGDNPASREALRRAVEVSRPDVLLYHNLIPVASLGLYDEARRLGLPVVQYIHNFRPFSPAGNLWVKGRVENAALRGNPWPEILGASWNGSILKTAVLAWHLARLRRSGALAVVKRWIAISEFMRERFVEAGIPEDRVVTLRHCWKVEGAAERTPDAGHYLFLGRLYASKGIDTLLDAWQLLEERLGAGCPPLVIAGKGPMEGAVRKVAARGVVRFEGFVEGARKRELLATSRALLAPSCWWEPLGLIVHEAYSHGCPVISSGSGGLAETVRDGESGFIHQPGDAQDLMEAVLRMEKTGRERRERMGEAGRTWLMKEASPARWRDGFASILASVACDGDEAGTDFNTNEN